MTCPVVGCDARGGSPARGLCIYHLAHWRLLKRHELRRRGRHALPMHEWDWLFVAFATATVTDRDLMAPARGL